MQKPDACNEKLYTVMKKCWHLKPEQRKWFSDICATVFI